MSNEKHTCECEVRSDTRMLRWHTCGKPAKGQLKNGMWACGIHLRAERQREERDRLCVEEQGRKAAHYNRLEKLSAKLGLNLLPAYNYPAILSYTRVEVNLEDLLKVIGHDKKEVTR